MLGYTRTKLDAACDKLVYRKHLENNLGTGPDCLDDFLMNCVMHSDELFVFSKIAFLHPHVAISKLSDSMFDHNNNNVVLFGAAGKWSMILVDPAFMVNRKKEYNSLDEFCKILGPYDDGLPKTIPNISACSTRDSDKASCSNWIAVIGMSARFPQANSLEEYWTILEQGRNTASSGPPPARAGLCLLDPSLSANFLACRVDQFDAEFFGVAPSEAELMDPQSRLALETSWEALEDAGIAPPSLRGSATGVFYGSWLQDYKELMDMESSPHHSSDFVRKYMCNGYGASAAKLSFFYGLAGPNIATESGCSSSIMAVELAVRSLLRGECNLALATGSNLILHWNEKKNFLWAPDGKSKTFDAAANGYGRAEGVGVLVLKRYSDAVASNDRIYGLICGPGGVSQEGESSSFGSPTVKSEAACMRACLRSAGLSPADVDYIEAHGTGTPVGDPIEAAAIVEAYACAAERKKFPLYIASGKTNIGHTESCSGIAGIIKVLLSMKHETIPRHLNVSQVNPKIINFEQIGAQIPSQSSVPWPRSPTRPRIAAVSSFGITGTDVHMMLREAPPPEEELKKKKNLSPKTALPSSPPASSSMPTPTMTVPHILCLSARTQPALEALTLGYLNWLGGVKNNEANECRLIADMCYTANACRTRHPLRRVLTGRTAEELRHKIRNGEWADGGGSSVSSNLGRPPRKKTPRVCFTFPGVIGKMEMAGARELYSSFPVFKRSMEECDAVYSAMAPSNSHLLPVLLLAHHHDDHDDEPPPHRVGFVERHAAVVAVQYSLAQLWKSWGIVPSFVMGHCVGEIVAAVVAEVMSLEDGFKIISSFHRFVELAAGEQGAEMLALTGDERTVEQLIEKFHDTPTDDDDEHHHHQLLEVAALNSKTQTVVTGPSGLIQKFAASCVERGGMQVKRVPRVDFPFHSRRIAGPLKECERELFPDTFSPPAIPYVSSVTGGLVGAFTKDYWSRCFRDKVQFTEACRTASTSLLVGADVFLEIGLGSSLSRLTAENFSDTGGGSGGSSSIPALCTPSFQRTGGGGGGGGTSATLASLIALGLEVDWSGYYQFHPISKVSLPHYPFQRKSYWFKKKRRSSRGRGRKFNNNNTAAAEIESLSSPQLAHHHHHPLLGRKVSLALAAAARQQQNVVVTFEVLLSSSPAIRFIRDHVIGSEEVVVFPAAGYLEMMLAAGIPDDDGGGRRRPPSCSISIQGFSVPSPLLVENVADYPNRLQTLIELEEEESTRADQSSTTRRKVSVYSERRGVTTTTNSDNDWKLHASGAVTTTRRSSSSSALEEDSIFSTTRRLDLQELLQRVPLVDSPGWFYQQLASVGLNFGPKFRSILTLHRNETEVVAVVQVPPGVVEQDDDDGHDGHILHPILIDSMIQACFVGKYWEQLGQRLHVPVSIPKFEFFIHPRRSVGGGGGVESDCCQDEERWWLRRFYVYVKTTRRDHHHHQGSSAAAAADEVRILLLDHEGLTVAIMENPVLVPTSVDAVMEAGGGGGGQKRAKTNTESTTAPLNTYKVVWEPALQQIPRPVRLGNSASVGGSSSSGLFPAISSTLPKWSFNNKEEEVRLEESTDRICLLYVLNMLYELGWEPGQQPQEQEQQEVGKKTSWLLANLLSEFRVKPSLAPAFSRYMDFLVEDGYLERRRWWCDKGDGQRRSSLLTLARPPPPWEAVKEELANSLELLQEESHYPALKAISACGSNLRAALQGELSGQFILFGTGRQGRLGDDHDDDGGEDTLAETYYSSNRFQAEHAAALKHVFRRMVQESAMGRDHSSSDPIRILEVGAGTGAFTRVALDSLAAADDGGSRPSFQYHFTDISPAHFEGAQRRFTEEHLGGKGGGGRCLVFKTLDIEKDPLGQGFPPAYFDIVVGVDVFHATSDLRQTISQVALVTRLGGFLLIGETERPIREVDLTFGILSGYWAFQDSPHLRRNHCLVRAGSWEAVLRGAGFTETSHLLTGRNQKSVVMGRLIHPAWDEHHHHPQQINKLDFSSSCWLAIGEHFPKEFNWLQGRMRGLGRELLRWHSSSTSTTPGPAVEDFLSQLIKDLGERERRLEGILVFAGRRPDGFSCEWRDRRELLKTLFATLKYLLGQRQVSPPLPALHLVTTGAWASGGQGRDLTELDPSGGALWGLARGARMEIPELNSKSIDLDPVGGAAADDDSMMMENNMERLLSELWLDDMEPEVLHRTGLRYVRRLRVEQSSKKSKSLANLEFPRSSRFQIALPKSRALSDIRFVPKKEEDGGGAGAKNGLLVSGQQIEVRLLSASLNFRDVLTVVKPARSVFESISVVGLDYAGVVTRVGPQVQRLRVGQRVYGLSTHESTISSHIVTEESHGAQIPPGLTFAQAATLPAVFLTVWYSMVVVAKVERGQSVLVHAVTGGVGLAAIQLGKILGVEVIGTAGSPRKRNYARSLGLQHVFNSRDLSFREQVKQATGGAGVDMVLNCLTGPGFKEASLELVKDGGHFVELSKLDVWSVEEVRSRRPRVTYELVWLPDVHPELISSMMAKMSELVESGLLRPLPSTRFLASQLPSALTTLQRAKQLGKVIVDLPSFNAERNRFTEQLFAAPPHEEDRTYLITGGLGAIGLAIAQWMVASQGARHIVLVGRSAAAPNPAVLEAIAQLRDEFHATIVTRQTDISSYEQCKALLDNLDPPLGGIHHCAGILSDKLLVNQDWAEFESVVNPKADGLYNLHRLTATLPMSQLQFFVAHSSMSSTFGNAGQANYTAANAYMDSLIAARVEAGLPGLVVNWGQWAVGLAAHLQVKMTATPFSTQEGIAALERFFKENKTSVVAGHFNFREATKMFPNYSHTLLRHIIIMDSGETKTGREEEVDVGGLKNTPKVDHQPFLLQYNKRKKEGMSEEEKGARMAGFVRGLVSSILGLGIEEIEDSVEFSAMGMDSLMSIDLTNKLQAELPGLSVGYIDMEEFGSVARMSGFLANLIN